MGSPLLKKSAFYLLGFLFGFLVFQGLLYPSFKIELGAIPAPLELQVFYSRDQQAYSEAYSAKRKITPQMAAFASLRLPVVFAFPDNRFQNLRLDLDEGKYPLTVRALRLRTLFYERVLDAAELKASFTPGNDIRALELDSDALLITAAGADPFLL